MDEDRTVVVTRVRGEMSGSPCFRGTRVNVETLFVNLAAGMSLAEILDAYPTLDAEDCRTAIEQAGDLLAAFAPWAEE